MSTLRVVHTADLHFGVENYGHMDPDTGLSTRLSDFIRTFNETIDWAIDKKVHLFVIAGDLFKNREPNPTVQRELSRCIRRLSRVGIPTFIITGNHDVPHAWQRANPMEIYSMLEVPYVTIAWKPGLHTIETKAGPVQVVALPWVARSQLTLDGAARNLTPDELSHLAVLLIEDFVTKMSAQINRSLPAIMVAHCAVSEATTSTERSMMLGNEPSIPRSVLLNEAFDYVALGHVHKYQVLGHGRPMMAYPGSLERIDFGEEKDKKGFISVEIDKVGQGSGDERKVELEFHEVQARRFVTLAITVDKEEPTEQILRYLESHGADLKDAVVRLIITVPSEAAYSLRRNDVYRAMRELGASYQVVNFDVERTSRTRLGNVAMSNMSREDLLRWYLDTKGASKQYAEEVVTEYNVLSGVLDEERSWAALTPAHQ